VDISGVLAQHARHRPDRIAVVFEDQRLDFRRLDRRVNGAANALRDLGIAKGDKVATFLTNSLEQLEVYWAAAKIGAVVVPLSPLLRGKGLSTLLSDADVTLVVTEDAQSGFLNEVRSGLGILSGRYLLIDGKPQGDHAYVSYHAIVACVAVGSIRVVSPLPPAAGALPDSPDSAAAR